MTPAEAAVAVRIETEAAVREINHRIMQKGVEASNKLRNSEIEMLTNPSPSAAGARPGVRSGNLRRSWNFGVTGGASSNGGASLTVYGEAKSKYAGYLEDGTRKMAARPYVDAIIKDVEPEIISLFSDL